MPREWPNVGPAYHEDRTLITPDSPAQRGESLTVYGTGFGATVPAWPEGLPVPRTPPFVLSDEDSALIGYAQVNAENAFAEPPDKIGVDAVQFRLARARLPGRTRSCASSSTGRSATPCCWRWSKRKRPILCS
jgi:uncharacterized protein (TIGR03437 family)